MAAELSIRITTTPGDSTLLRMRPTLLHSIPACIHREWANRNISLDLIKDFANNKEEDRLVKEKSRLKRQLDPAAENILLETQ